MIYDTLNNLPNYLGVSDNLDTVIEYIMARDITTLPAGRTRIDGEKAVVTVSTVTPQSSDKALWAPPAPASPACCARAGLPCIWPGSPTNPA